MRAVQHDMRIEAGGVHRNHAVEITLIHMEHVVVVEKKKKKKTWLRNIIKKVIGEKNTQD